MDEDNFYVDNDFDLVYDDYLDEFKERLLEQENDS